MIATTTTTNTTSNTTTANTGAITFGPVGSAAIGNYAVNTSGSNSWPTSAKVHTDDIMLRGQSLNERLETIEIMLNIPTRDVIMEKKYPKLAQIHKDYMEALATLRTWDTLKESV